ncbi:hypothetical protein C4D60_Mb01t29070 [Musa balbisiana]|uniref:Formin-like protein n=1 Tax=Musa balbisiana TaxID=52838 RepID=A0A4S8JRJ6_MUSBA|nr:hypothetical protein C4D60_Mb01t29070 [Musa balbisiana]
MALFRKFFYRKPPDGLLEISERVYVFDCCFTTDVLEQDEYKVYIGGIVAQLRDNFPDASFMVFNFREGETQSQISSILSEYDMTVMDYPRQYEGCPLLTMEMIHHFLRSSESWLSLGQQNLLLMHCERGGWPVLAFMLAALLVYRKQYAGEQRTLDMIYKQAPHELLHFLSPLNPLPSQLRYLHYISRRNVGAQWPPLDRALTLDCIILRFIPDFDGTGGCRPIFRIYGQDPFIASDRTPKVLFSTPKKSKLVRFYKQEDCELVKIDVHCHIQGDVVLECISLDEDLEREVMMFRVMFNTAFIRSNILMLDRDAIDILWDSKDRFLKDFRVEVILSEMDAANSLTLLELTSGEEKEGLPVEAFAKVQEMFNNLDWLETKADSATKVLQQINSSKNLQEKLDAVSPQKLEADVMLTKSVTKSVSPLNRSSDSVTKNQNTELHEVPSSPAWKFSTSASHTFIPSLPSHCGIPSQSNDKSTSIPPPPPPPFKGTSLAPTSASLKKPASATDACQALSSSITSKSVPSPPPPPSMLSLSPHTNLLPLRKTDDTAVIPPPPPPPSPSPGPGPVSATRAPPPPPPPQISSKHSGDITTKSSSAPPVPPPPLPSSSMKNITALNSSGGRGTASEVIPPPPPNGMSSLSGGRGRGLARMTNSRNMQLNQLSSKKANLKPLHWIKVTRAVQGSLWAESQNLDEFSKAPEFDMSELESLFSAVVPNSGHRGSGSKSSGRSMGPKSDKVHLSSVLALDDSMLDVDQIDNLIKFCPTKEEMELLKGYNGDKENLGKCEQVADLKGNLNIVNSTAQEIRSSVKLKRIMQTILSLGNALNQGTARGSAVGFRLDSLLKLSDTRARNNKMTLMHYLCKVIADKLPELLDFPKDLVSLDVAAKIQLKTLAEEMQAISKGLEKVEQELTASENDGPVSQTFCKTLKEFLVVSEAEVRALTSLYSNVGRNADALTLYFGEDPARCPFEQVVSTLLNFVKMFARAHEENCKQLELEKKKARKEAEQEKVKNSHTKKEPQNDDDIKGEILVDVV